MCTVYLVGAAGMAVKESFSKPICCTDPGDEKAPPLTQKHSFLLSSVCPVNIPGRDLILAFGLNLLSAPDGLVVSRSDFAHIFFKDHGEVLFCISGLSPSPKLTT